MRSKGMFIVLPSYDLLRHHAQLRISPLGCVPQQDCRPHIINDYTYSGVNPSTNKMALPEAMHWGQALNRVLWYICTADRRQDQCCSPKQISLMASTKCISHRLVHHCNLLFSFLVHSQSPNWSPCLPVYPWVGPSRCQPSLPSLRP